MLVGSHLSVAGGLHLAVQAAVKLKLDCVQIFTKNQRQWKCKPLDPQEVAHFKAAVKAAGWSGDESARLVSHNSYLVNMASPSDEARQKSTDAQRVETERCEELGVPSCVMHPGAHLGQKGNAADEEAGLRRLAAALDQMHRDLPGYRTVTCLENTVGSGTNLGGPWEHLARVRSMVKEPERVAVCIDTCHATAFGHDMSTPAAVARAWARFDQTIGFGSLRAMHVNDSKGALGSHLDRHEHLGAGACGKACFEFLANDKRFARIPLIMETPKEGKLRRQDPDRANSSWLRARARGSASACVAVLAACACLHSTGCRAWAAPSGEYAAAERALPATPTADQRARMEAAQQVAQRGEYQKALAEFREILIENPRISQAHVGVAKVQLATGDTRAAERAYEQALRIDPHSAAARKGLAQLYLQTGRAGQALAEFQRALLDAPGDRECQEGIVQIMGARGDTAGTIPLLRELSRGAGSKPSDWVRLGTACLASGHPVEAADALEEALVRGASGTDVLTSLTEAYTAQGRYGEAASTADELARRAPSAAAWEKVGWLQFRQGDYPRSAAAYRRATELEPGSERAWNGVAITALNAWLLSDRLDQSSREEARRALNRSLEINPSQPAMVKLRDSYKP